MSSSGKAVFQSYASGEDLRSLTRVFPHVVGCRTARVVGGVFTGLGARVAFLRFRLFRRRAAAAALVSAMLGGGMLAPVRGLAADKADRPGGFDPEVARKFAGVQEWQGFWEVTETRSISKSNSMGYRENVYEGSGYGRFVLHRSIEDGWDPARGDFRWLGNGEASGMRNETMSSWSKSGPRMVGDDWRDHDDGQAPMKDVEFTIWMNRQYAALHAGLGTQGAVKTTRKGRRVSEESSADGQHHYAEQDINESRPGAIPTFFVNNYEKTKARHYQVVQGGPGVLVFTEEERGHDATGGDSLRRSQVVMVPVYDNLECEVTIEGYAQWRPKGSIADPKKPGNGLVARAVLKSKDGTDKDLPEVDRFRFELLDTSREPGICLNWPLGAKDDDYDLRLADFKTGSEPDRLAAMRKFMLAWRMRSMGDFDPENMPDGGVPKWSFPEVDENGQKGELPEPPKDKDGHPYAEAAIECFDFGAKSELRVTCILKDGRELLGLMKSEGGQEDLVRLPKRNGPDWIAESWRKEHDVMKLAASDDNEEVAGQPLNGDGFTLYEEYRGWVEKGKDIEGDPKKKDLFVRNEIGADAKGGIALFERVSKIKVHADLRANELISLPVVEVESVANAKGERIMNWNHRDAPHRVDQHGVIMINTSGFRSSGGATKGVINDDKKNRAFRPGKVQFIRVEGRGVNDGIFSGSRSSGNYNLSERDAAFAYDRGVAHELLHAVGVDHHGEGEEAQMFYFQGAGDPMNATHRARFVGIMPPTDYDLGRMVGGRPAVWSDFDRGPTITLRWEDTHEDVAESLNAEFERELAAERAKPLFTGDGSRRAAKFPQYGKDAHFWSEFEINEDVSDGLTTRGFREGVAPKFSRFVTIGRWSQADSGNELCLMRYYFASAYPVDAQEKAFYLVRPGANRAGRDLCKTPEGTGANAADHEPKSRFSDSAPGRGGCFKYICPNDAIPGRTL